ncbi:RfaG Glycosyltransferase [uncultured Caudovirales phage]|uniref:RfaG Glycosyltransferase n=1 Tax=uncultured Caudovirales phage TaxID=2100421 RepID=A0A6J5M580_9CAUD|nr:RfaG Glycosyltransferase [uncultured Caudovirales phage]
MNILFSLHLYPPHHMCGAEMVAHTVMRFLKSKGHRVRALHHRSPEWYEYEGVEVMPKSRNIMDQMRWADVIFTHLDFAKWTIHMGRMLNIPTVFFVHNTSDWYDDILKMHPGTKVVYNSHAAKEMLQYNNPSCVLHPPCDWRHYEVDNTGADAVTLINLDHNKGGHILRQIAEAMPKQKFIGVKGSYSADDNGQFTDQPPNVEVLPLQSDIREVYKRTRVLIMPSEYESWGRTMTEAMCSGIPVISTPTFGLKENAGDAGIFIEDRDDIKAWVKAIRSLSNAERYKVAREAARKRSRELDPIGELEAFYSFLF